jgi:hypothetical protein
LSANWKGLLALLAALMVFGLAVAWYQKSIQTAAAEMLDDNPDGLGIRVITLSATNDDGHELLNQNVVVQEDPVHLKIGPHPSANVYLPEASRAVRMRIQPDGSVWLRNGFTWREIVHGEPIDLGGVHLVTTLDIQDEEEIDHAN